MYCTLVFFSGLNPVVKYRQILVRVSFLLLPWLSRLHLSIYLQVRYSSLTCSSNCYLEMAIQDAFGSSKALSSRSLTRCKPRCHTTLDSFLYHGLGCVAVSTSVAGNSDGVQTHCFKFAALRARQNYSDTMTTSIRFMSRWHRVTQVAPHDVIS